MSIRDTIRSGPGAAAFVVLALSVAAYVTVSSMSRPKIRVGDAFFYDLGDGRLFVVSGRVYPPTNAPVGGAEQGVQAVVYGCADCGESDRHIAYLLSFTPEARALLDKPPAELTEQENQVIDRGKLIAPVPNAGESPAWFSAHDGRSSQLTMPPNHLCESGKLRTCMP